MKAAGVMRGTYHLFRPTQDPRAQAAVLVREITARGGLQPGDLPPALDIEVTDGVDADTPGAARHLASPRRRGVAAHTDPPHLARLWEDLGEDHAFDRYSLWVAHWDTRCPRVPGAWERWRFWQDASSGAVPGVEGPVDTDWFHGTRADLEASPAAARAWHVAPAAPRAKALAPTPRRRRSAPRTIALGDFLRVLSLP